MAANTNPIFSLTPGIAQAQVSTANANRDGTGTLATVIAGSTNGRRVHRITIKATVTTTAGMVRLFLDDGANVRLFAEVIVTAITVGASTKGFESVLTYTGETPLVLPSGVTLKASTHNAEAINVIAEYSDY